MGSRDSRVLRITGVAGIAAAVAWTFGDVFLLGARATPGEYPILAEYAGAGGMAAQVVQAGVQFFPSSPARLAAGALIAVLTTPLYLAAVWHIYLALMPARAAILATATRATMVLFGTYAVLVLVTLAGFVWMIVTIAQGRSRYPRWVAWANPIVMMVIGSVLDRILPPPLSMWLEGAGLNLGMLFFMILSTVLVWKQSGTDGERLRARSTDQFRRQH